MLALTHTLLVEGLHDRAFLDRCTTGWDTLAGYLDGSADGIPKDADWAAPICGIAPDRIRGLARRMAATRTLVTVTWSLQRARYGEQPVWAGLALAAALGQIGLPGGGFGHGYGSMGDVGDTGSALRLPFLPQGPNPVDEFIPCARIADLLLHPGEEYDYDGTRRRYPDIRLVHWAGGNPFHHHQDLGRLRRAFARPDTVVVHEPHWTATARHADIVLPITTALEREDLGGGRRDTHLIAMHRAVAPYGEARDDHAVLAALAERLGFGAEFTEGRTPRGWLVHLYEEWADRLRADGAGDPPPFRAFWSAGEWRLPEQAAERTLFEEFRADPEGRPLATPAAGSSSTPPPSRPSPCRTARATRPGWTRPSGSAPPPPSVIRCCWSPTSPRPGCTANSTSAHRACPTRWPAGRRSNCTRPTPPPARSATATWYGSSTTGGLPGRRPADRPAPAGSRPAADRRLVRPCPRHRTAALRARQPQRAHRGRAQLPAVPGLHRPARAGRDRTLVRR
ncbi:hypothetical protein GCM10025734_13500 [Kitasatospora paranensis]